MTKRIHIKPGRPGLRLIDPVTGRAVPDEGAHVVPGHYWNRRIADGDAIKVERGARKSSRKPAPESNDEAEG